MEYLQKHYSLQDFGEEKFHAQNSCFSLCAFVQTRFGDATFENCTFLACEFPYAIFGKAKFKRCLFKNCEFSGAFFDDASFEECRAYQCNFEGASFKHCNFDFLRTDYCNFNQARFSKEMTIPLESRELVGEIIRQISDDLEILVFSSFVKNYKVVCWEKFIEYSKKLTSKENQLKMIDKLGQYAGAKHLLEKWKASE